MAALKAVCVVRKRGDSRRKNISQVHPLPLRITAYRVGAGRCRVFPECFLCPNTVLGRVSHVRLMRTKSWKGYCTPFIGKVTEPQKAKSYKVKPLRYTQRATADPTSKHGPNPKPGVSPRFLHSSWTLSLYTTVIFSFLSRVFPWVVLHSFEHSNSVYSVFSSGKIGHLSEEKTYLLSWDGDGREWPELH